MSAASRASALVLVALVGAGCASGGRLQVAWQSELGRDHPLSGRVWAPRAGRFVDGAALERAVAGAGLVLLGEIHDNPDHHVLQARLLRAAAAAHRSAFAVAFEQLDQPQQPAIDAALAAPGASPDSLAAAVAWDSSGWPPFAIYRPIVAAALELGAKVVAANLSREAMRQVVKEGPAALPEPARGWLERAPALPAAQREALGAEMQASHCGMLPPAMLQPMVEAQRARDAQLAAALVTAAGPDGGRAALIAGGGHVRDDRGVPALLRAEAPSRSLVAVGLVEVEPGRATPAAYADSFGGALPFDFVVFTPAARREDPCARLRQQIEQHARPGKPGPGAN